MENKNQVKEDKLGFKFITVLTIALLLLSLVSLGMALFMNPVQSATSSVQGKVIVNVIVPISNEIEPGTMTGKVILNVVTNK